MKSKQLITRASLLALLAIALAGCEVGTSSPNNLIRNVGVDYSGYYTGQNTDSAIPSKQTGALISNFNLIQTGDTLQAIDNNGEIWKGEISNTPDANNLTATFTMKGKTSTGAKITMVGILTKTDAKDQEATMSGTWIEPTFYATFKALGTVSATATNGSSGGTLVITPAHPTGIAAGGTVQFSVSGNGSATVNWTAVNGTLTTSTGTSTTFTLGSSGTQASVTASDSAGHTKTAQIN